ncbi:MAG: hypothetical protein ABI686_08680 [Acidobacteriota bacterium]
MKQSKFRRQSMYYSGRFVRTGDSQKPERAISLEDLVRNISVIDSISRAAESGNRENVKSSQNQTIFN